jgi:hypothetical protein
LFGADFQGLRGAALLLAEGHLASVALVVLALGLVAWRTGRGARISLVDQVLAVGIAANILLYLGTLTSTEGAHEIAIALPYSAALTARMLTPAAIRLATLRGATRRLRRLLTAGAVAGALTLAGYTAGLGFELTVPSAPPQEASLASWLLEHDLRSGLAGYWQSSSVTVETGGRVTVRAVRPGTLSPYLWMADQAWYDPAANSPRFLILKAPSRSELTQLATRLGHPRRTYQAAGFTVLVWNHSLLSAAR